MIQNTFGTSPRPNVSYGNLQCGFNTVIGSAPNDIKTTAAYNQTMGDAGTIALGGSNVYQHTEATNKTVYAVLLLAGGNGNSNVTATFTAVRIG